MTRLKLRNAALLVALCGIALEVRECLKRRAFCMQQAAHFACLEQQRLQSAVYLLKLAKA
jgi:hypothetical protein